MLILSLIWTFIHSLWQGLILTFLAGMVLLFSKKASANLRYNLLAGLFALFLATTIVTFFLQIKNTQIVENQSITINNEIQKSDFNNLNNVNSTVDNAVITQTKSEQIIDFFNQNANWIFLFWTLIFSFKCIKILLELGFTYRIRNYKTHSATVYWNERLLILRQQLDIKKQVILLQSDLVTVPTVIGFLKPVILVPMGILAKLPTSQIEAVLLHELAHIRRYDYAVNFLQHLAEMVFFFNPAVLWISNLLREERENCCDDLAISTSKNKKNYVEALLAFQEYHLEKSNLNLAFTGQKNNLLARVERIIHQKNKTLNSMEKIFLILSIVLAALFTFGAAENVQAQSNQLIDAPKMVEAATEKSESKLKKSSDLTTNTGDKKYKIVLKENNVSAFYIDNQRVRNDNLPDNEAVNLLLQKDNIEQNENLQNIAIPNEILLKNEMEQDTKTTTQTTTTITQTTTITSDDKEKNILLNRHKLLYGKALQIKRKDNIDVLRSINPTWKEIETTLEKGDISKVNLQKIARKLDWIERHIQLAEEHEQEDVAPSSAYVFERTELKPVTIDVFIIEDLIKDNIVKENIKVSFMLARDKFIINGARQSEDILKKYKLKYNVKKRSEVIIHNWYG